MYNTFLLVLLIAATLADSSSLSELKAKAQAGDPKAQVALGRVYEHGQGVPQNDEAAAKWYGAAAEQGDADGQNSLGIMYALGRGVVQDRAEAVRLYRRAAAQGHSDAMFNVAAAYYNGDGVPFDEVAAYVWFRFAQQSGNAAAADGVQRIERDFGPARLQDAKLRSAQLLVTGEAGRADAAEAARLFREAAEAGRADAMVMLADLYLEGRGVPKDISEALKWLRKKPSAAANLRLGDLYWDGTAVPQNFKEAVTRYAQSLEFYGFDRRVFYRLGVAAREGRGMGVDPVMACVYFGIGGDLGDVQADAAFQQLFPSLDAAQQKKVRKRAADWLSEQSHFTVRSQMAARRRSEPKDK